VLRLAAWTGHAARASLARVVFLKDVQMTYTDVISKPISNSKSLILFDPDPFEYYDRLCERRFDLMEKLKLLKSRLHSPQRERYLTDDWKFKATMWLIEIYAVQEKMDNIEKIYPDLFSNLF
jgi:hypothetical protein